MGYCFDPCMEKPAWKEVYAGNKLLVRKIKIQEYYEELVILRPVLVLEVELLFSADFCSHAYTL